MITNISSSVLATGMHNRNNNLLYRNGIVVNSFHQNSSSQSCWSMKCSNPVLTCIVATVLPITITSLLICGFMMQKNNLHEYAIYTFVIFCVAFIFPFVLFFFTVILNKIFKFYKRVNTGSEASRRPPEQNMPTNGGHNHSQSLSNIRSSNLRESDAEYCDSNYHLSVDYRDVSNRVFVNLSPDQHILIDDNPPTYEMALLCPTVQLTNSLDYHHIQPTNQLALEEKDI